MSACTLCGRDLLGATTTLQVSVSGDRVPVCADPNGCRRQAIKQQLTDAERSALLSVVHGAQDDDDGSEPDYTAALASLTERARQGRAA